jgi:hypothetical protein
LSDRKIVISYSVWLYWFVLSPFFITGVMIAMFSTKGLWERGGIFSHWPLIIPSTVALAIYALLHVEYRYVAPFIVILFLSMFAGTRLPPERSILRGISGVLMATAVVLMIPLGIQTAQRVAAELRHEQTSQTLLISRTTEALQDAGVKPGTQVATIGGLLHPYWARMLGLRIIAEVPFDQRMTFWFGGADVRRRVLSAIHQTGASVVVAENVPGVTDTSGWNHVEGTDVWWTDFRRGN